jgi:glycine dehydrogenase subunit 2
MLVRAYTYIRVHGPEGLRRIAEHAVLNANYLQARLRGTYPIPHGAALMHEFVAWASSKLGRAGAGHCQAADRLDHAHPPTICFPSLFTSMMIEPTRRSKQHWISL